MYPRLSDIFADLFGIQLPFPIYSFGAMVAVAVLFAIWLTGREIDRLYNAGVIPGVKMPQEGRRRKKEVSPSVLLGTIAIIVVVAGVAGAKVFHILENLDRFWLDPAGMIFATGGLTFYGGFIVAGLAIVWYLRRYDLPPARFADASAPGLLAAYGIGRIGCHLAGDGDWGIAADVAAKPDWLPMWLWAETYPNAIIGSPPEPVHPTPLYELAMASVLAAVLWMLRKHPFQAGWLFSLYLVFSGAERLLIEQIRVNVEFDLLGLVVTQAEVISVGLIVLGLAGLWYTGERTESPTAATA